MRKRNGEIVDILISAQINRNAEEDSYRIEGIVHDMTNQKSIERALRVSEEKYRNLIEQMGEGVAIVDETEKFTFVNNAAARIFGYTKEELLEKNLKELTAIDEFEKIQNETVKRKSGKSSSYDLKIIRKNGTKGVISISVTPLIDVKEGFVGTYGIIRDITEKTRIEQALRISEEKYRAIFEHSLDLHFQTDEKGIINILSPSVEILAGYLQEELIGRRASALFLKRREYIRFVKLIEDNVKIVDFETMLIKKNGEITDVQINAQIVRDHNDESFVIEGNIHDISERKIAEEALRISEEKYRNLIEELRDLVFTIDPQGIITFMSKSSKAILGYDYKELLGMNIIDLVPDNKKNVIHKKIQAGLRGKKITQLQVEVSMKTGEQVFLEISVSGIWRNDKVTGALAVARDITSRRKVQEELKFRANFEEIINTISTRFINLPTNRIDPEIEVALGNIGRFVNVDRGFLFLINHKQRTMNNTHEWCAPEIVSNKNNFQDVPIEIFPWWMEKMVSGNVIKINSLEELPESAVAEKEAFREQNVKSVLAFSLNYRQNLMGFIGLLSIHEPKKWEKGAVNLLKNIGEIFVNAIKRKEQEEKLNDLYQSLLAELDLASSVQSYLLPKWVNVEKDIILSQTYTPSSRIGGDLFDMIPLDDGKYVIYIADISGHGVQAALIMTAVKSIINMVVDNEKDNFPSPSKIINRLNQILTREIFKSGNYMTILFCIVDVNANKLRYFNAGHPSMIKYDQETGQGILLKDKGSIPIGWTEETEYFVEDEDEIDLGDNSQFIMYTDGIFECENKDDKQLGLQGLLQILNKSKFEPHVVTLPERFKQKLLELDYDTSTDDFTIISFQRKTKKRSMGQHKIFEMASVLHASGEVGNECSQMVLDKFDDPKLAFSIEIIVNEYLNNIISHGLKYKSDTSIAMEIGIADRITLKFWDRGLAWKLPDRNKLIEDFEKKDATDESGRGLFIIYMNSETMELNRYGDLNETVITIGTDNKS